MHGNAAACVLSYRNNLKSVMSTTAANFLAQFTIIIYTAYSQEPGRQLFGPSDQRRDSCPPRWTMGSQCRQPHDSTNQSASSTQLSLHGGGGGSAFEISLELSQRTAPVCGMEREREIHDTTVLLLDDSNVHRTFVLKYPEISCRHFNTHTFTSVHSAGIIHTHTHTSYREKCVTSDIVSNLCDYIHLAKEGKGGGPPPFIAQIFFDVVSKTTRILPPPPFIISELAKIHTSL